MPYDLSMDSFSLSPSQNHCLQVPEPALSSLPLALPFSHKLPLDMHSALVLEYTRCQL